MCEFIMGKSTGLGRKDRFAVICQTLSICLCTGLYATYDLLEVTVYDWPFFKTLNSIL